MEDQKDLIPQQDNPQDQPLTTSEVVNRNLQLVLGADIIDQKAMVFKTRCTVCNAECRKEVERMFEAAAKQEEIRTYLASQGVVISITNLRHHFKEHYNSKERMMLLLDYCDNLAEMMKNRRDRMSQLQMLSAVGEMELMRAVGMPTGGDFNKEKERTDLIQKAQKMICENIKLMTELDDAEAKAKAVYVAVITTFKNKIEASKTEEEKKTWRTFLLDFKSSLPDIGGSQ